MARTRKRVFVAVVAATAAYAQSARSYYDSGGRYIGSATTRGNTSTFSDRGGKFSGSSIRHGNSTSVYDSNGRFVGSSRR